MSNRYDIANSKSFKNIDFTLFNRITDRFCELNAAHISLRHEYLLKSFGNYFGVYTYYQGLRSDRKNVR
jgi:hypothetical protein